MVERKKTKNAATAKGKIQSPRIELGTYCVLGSRHNQLDHPCFPWVIICVPVSQILVGLHAATESVVAVFTSIVSNDSRSVSRLASLRFDGGLADNKRQSPCPLSTQTHPHVIINRLDHYALCGRDGSVGKHSGSGFHLDCRPCQLGQGALWLKRRHFVSRRQATHESCRVSGGRWVQEWRFASRSSSKGITSRSSTGCWRRPGLFQFNQSSGGIIIIVGADCHWRTGFFTPLGRRSGGGVQRTARASLLEWHERG